MTIEQLRSYLGQTEEQFNSAISALKEKEPQIISGGYAFETYFDGKIVLNVNSLRSHLVEDSFITTGVIVALNFGIKKVQIYYTSDIKDAVFYYRTTETSNFLLSWEIIEEPRMVAESSVLANVRNLAVPTIVGSGTGISFSNVHKIPTVANTSKVESYLLSSSGEVPSSNDNGDANKPISGIADRLKFIGDKIQQRAIIKGLENESVKIDYTVDFNNIKTSWVSLSRNNPNCPPTTRYGIFSVYGDDSIAIQTFSTFASSVMVYGRSFTSGAWQQWKIITQDQESINAHLADASAVKPILHTTQTEKDTWNGKATIKGLENADGIIINPTISDNANNVVFNSSYYVNIFAGKINYPPNTGVGILNTFGTSNGVVSQTFQELLIGNIYHRNKVDLWSNWRLISAPKMFATGYIDSYTVGSGNINVLFDDGVTRLVEIGKAFGTSALTFFVRGLTITDIAARRLNFYKDSVEQTRYRIWNLTSSANGIMLQGNFFQDGVVLHELTITIKL